jgi:3-oxoacyl-[acyl-carrier protein] reductase
MTFENRFEDQVAVVTGGASGIGLAIGIRLAQEGAAVVLADLQADALETAAQSLREVRSTSAVMTVTADVSNEQDVAHLMDYAVERFGKIDVVVHSAGIAGPTATKILDYDLAAFKRVIDINLIGSFLVAKYAVRAMLPANYGRILLLASIAGKDGNPGMAGYTASKAGLIGLVKGIGKEYAETQITINALAPAVIATPMNLQTAPAQLDYMKSRIPMGRLGTVDEVASIASWIVSKEASFNTGCVFDLTGGRATY